MSKMDERMANGAHNVVSTVQNMLDFHEILEHIVITNTGEMLYVRGACNARVVAM